MENLIEVKNLYHRYEDGQKMRAVLKDINITFETGKLYAVVGSSGSGKTTLLSLLSGLDSVQDGDITYLDESINDIGYTKYRKEFVNVIFQSYNLINYMTAIQNVITAVDIKKVKVHNKKEKAYEILESLGIDKETADREVLKISGGEQQRVAIARALVHDSKVILADEPTGNLDDDTEDEIIDIFKDLASKGKCVIIVTHSQNVAKHADIIYEIKKGKIEIKKD
ncbi:MAG: putative ABC transporter ATP-binding protein [Candidatus Izimaplasma bacterium HR2]|nr:MAG: putative ABC transporter ATP-binding protein [Candidatus Izimaplasma bacterium HR2]